MNQHKVPDATLDAILQPIEKATGLPNQAYTSNEFFAEERISCYHEIHDEANVPVLKIVK